MLLAAIEVEFDPNWTDEWLVWLTAASVLASAVLGWLAYWNGKNATEIASKSARRDAIQRQELADMQASEYARQAKVRRYEFGAALRRLVNDTTMKLDDRSDDGKRRSYEYLDRLSAHTGEPAAEDLRGYVVQRAHHAKAGYKGLNLTMGTIGELFDLIGKWVEDPDKVSINVEDAWADTIKLIERVKSEVAGNREAYQDLLDSLDDS